ncbi:MAG: spermidine synthase [Rhodospirillales bacterium]
MATRPQTSPRGAAAVARFVPLFLAFFLSGASALVYQTAWQRMLGIFGGSDSITAALVVGAFLLGLGLGSLWASVFVDRCSARRAILLFAACEAGIGLCGAASPAYFHDVLLSVLSPLAGGRAAVFGAAFLGMLAPTLLMGLSLPLLSRGVVEEIATSAQRIGALYAVNTLGAGLGAFAAGLWAIGTYGFEGAIYGAAAINLAVGAVAAVAGALAPRGPAHPGTAAGAPASLAAVPWRIWQWGGLVFVSGFLIIALEIVWFRVIGVMAEGNVYTFPIVLGVFLVADAAGIVLGVRVVRRAISPRRLFLALQTAVGLYALASLLAMLGVIGSWPFTETLGSAGALSISAPKAATVLALTVFLVAPPAVLLGMSFPIVQRAVQEDPAVVGQRVGVIQLCNILGNAAGSLVTGLVLLHVLGASGTLRAVGLIALAVTGLLLAEAGTRRLRRQVLAAGAALVAAIAAFPGGAAFWKRIHLVPPSVGSVHAEDRTGIALARLDRQARLFVFGHSQSHLPFQSYHVLLGAVGTLAHPAPKSVLVIGAGLGATPYAAGIDPAVERVRVVELVEPVYAVQDRVLDAGRDAGLAALRADPRYTHVFGDGRRDLAIGGARYDVIEADAILPTTANSGLLYSTEFFALVRANLAPGGIAVQWAPTRRTVATFAAVFPHVVHLKPLDVLLGSDGPIAITPEALRARLDEPAIRDRLAAARLSPDAVASHATSIAATWGPQSPRPASPLNTDLFPRDEYYLNNPPVAD